MRFHFKDLIRPLVGRRIGLDDVVGMIMDVLGVMSLLVILTIGAIFAVLIIVWVGT